MQKLSGSNSVFVGNIPFDSTEASMIEIFKEVGPVSRFTIHRDRETGKPKGFGFCEFLDAATAASAIRNLDGYDIGGRKLNVKPADAADNVTSFRPQNFPMQPPPQNQGFPPNINLEARQGVVNANSQSVEAINSTLLSMTPPQIFELLTQMMVQHNPHSAKAFLVQNSHLCYALYQAMKMMNLIDNENDDNYGVRPIVPTQNTNFGGPVRPEIRPHMRNPNQTFPRVPHSAQPNFPIGHPAQPVRSAHFPPPHHQPQFRAPPVNEGLKEDQQEALIRQVMNMTPGEIEQLPAEQRQDVLRLRAQLMGGHPTGSS